MTHRRLLFAGSGLSAALGLPSWRHLLRQITDDTLYPRAKIPILHLLEAPGQEYEAARQLAGLLGRPRLESEIISLLRRQQNRVQESGSPQSLITPLRNLAKTGIVTTNWDTLLPHITGYRPLLWPRDVSAFTAALRDDERFVLYLHGNIDHPPLVITPSDREAQAQTLRTSELKLETILAIHTLIVIGSSFPDHHLNELYAVASRIAGHDSRLRVVLMTAQDSRAFRNTHPSLAQGTLEFTYGDYSGFQDALTRLAAESDPSESILRIPYINPHDAAALHQIVSPQDYDFRSTSRLRERYLQSSSPTGLLSTSASLLIDVSPNDPVTGGLLATLLATAGDPWDPDPSVLTALASFCDASLATNPDSIGIVEPLAFAIARKGTRAQHARYLVTVISDPDWRRADIQRIGQYYEDTPTQLTALKRHLADERRDGRLRANDLTRLMSLLEFVDIHVARTEVIPMLDECIRVLYTAGDHALAIQMEREKAAAMANKHQLPAG